MIVEQEEYDDENGYYVYVFQCDICKDQDVFDNGKPTVYEDGSIDYDLPYGWNDIDFKGAFRPHYMIGPKYSPIASNHFCKECSQHVERFIPAFWECAEINAVNNDLIRIIKLLEKEELTKLDVRTLELASNRIFNFKDCVSYIYNGGTNSGGKQSWQ
jgi:hypothetical protein